MIYDKFYRQLRYVAEKVRLATECIAEDEDWEDPNELCGYCARASAMISYELTKRDIRHKLIYSDWGHVHVRVGRYLIDTTATQFHSDMPRVIVRSAESMARLQNQLEVDKRYWSESEAFDYIDELISWQAQDSWPEEQSVNQYDIFYLPRRKKKMVQG